MEEGLLSLFDNMEAWHWFGFALLLIIVELTMIGAYFLIWVGGAAALVGLIMLISPDISTHMQLVIWSLASIFGLTIWFFYRKKNPVTHETSEPFLNERGAKYVGRVFTLEEALKAGIDARIKVDDTVWTIRSEVDVKKGSDISVIGCDSNVLMVGPKKD